MSVQTGEASSYHVLVRYGTGTISYRSATDTGFGAGIENFVWKAIDRSPISYYKFYSS